MSVLPTSIEYSGSTLVWDEHGRSVIDPIDAASAERRHAAGEEYGGVVPVGEGVAGVAVIGTAKVQVKFHGVGPGTLLYAFDRNDRGLWLSEVQRRNGKGRHPDACADFFRWPATGEPADVVRFDNETPRGRLLAERTDWDPEANQLAWPDFGAYDALVDPDLLAKVWPDAPPLPPRGS